MKTSSATTSSGPTAEDQATISDINNQLSQLEKEQKALEAAKNKAKSNRTQAEAYKRTLDKQISNVEDQLDLLGNNIDKLNKKIADQEAQIGTLNDSISKNIDLLKQRLRAIYMRPKSTELEAILSAKSFSELLARAEILRRISEHDTEIISNLKQEKQDVQALKSDTEAKKVEATTAQKKQEAKMAELDKMYEESNAYITQLKSDEAAYAKELAAIEAENKELEKQLADIYSKYKSTNPTYVGGEMAWPAPGFSKISSPYGYRSGVAGRSSEFHTGVDIAGSGIYGKPVVAANDGTVVGVYNLGSKSYGKYIIIDHGGGVWTYYCHLSSQLVSAGDKVKRGQTIGKVGSTGRSTGPHLHFEVRINNKHTNPMPYIT